MAGYTPWMAGSVAAAKRANAAAAYNQREARRAEYNEYRAEGRACGYDVESFEAWLGEITEREQAEARVWGGHTSISDACYYGDTY